MGNRARIITENRDVQVYLHWNGGKESVKAFLDFCKAKGYREPEDDSYGWARLCQVVGNFFGGTLSVGIGAYTEDDPAEYDNGTYIIREWKIIGREHVPSECVYTTESVLEYASVLKYINKAQPESERLPDTQIEDIISHLCDSTAITAKKEKED